jgi:hypothetical protein
MKRIIIGVLGALMAVLAFAGCSSVSTEPDEAAVVYNGGSFSSKSWSGCLDSGKREWNGPGDTGYIYPQGKRTFSFTGAEGSERDPMPVTTGSQEVLVPGFVTFTLNTECDTLREFHETVGNKYKAYKDGGGWDDFLSDYIAVPLSSTLNKAAGSIEPAQGTTRDQNWQLLYNDAETQNAFEEYVKENLPDEIEQTLGEDFIKVNEVSISKPTISEGLKESLEEKEKARLDNEAQAERNKTVRTQYQTISDCLKTGLTEENCTLIFLQQSGAEIPFLPVPQGGAINFQKSSE